MRIEFSISKRQSSFDQPDEGGEGGQLGPLQVDKELSPSGPSHLSAGDGGHPNLSSLHKKTKEFKDKQNFSNMR